MSTKIKLLLIFCILGCEPAPPTPSDPNVASVTINGQVYNVPNSSAVILTFENGTLQVKENQTPSEQFIVKIIDVDFIALLGKDNYIVPTRIITCEYQNSRHYAVEENPFRNVPYIGEEWLAHYDNEGEITFDNIAK